MSGAETILEPALPFDMKGRARRAGRDVQLQQFVHKASRLKYAGRINACVDAFGARYDEVRSHAGAIKQHTLDHLDHYLAQFMARAAEAGVQVHCATDAAEARALCLAIAQAHNSRLCVKSKSMVTEEIRLLPALTAAGVQTIETDLGEFIVQLDDDAPSHIVTPMIHKDRKAVARAFVRELESRYTEDPRELTMIARAHMRELYQRADLGISGANFLIADTGSLVICTNEGNADLAVNLPPVHIAVVGIEKVIPSSAHLPTFLKLLARSATAQAMTVYTSVITGPRTVDESEGPRQVHVILLDNGRIDMLKPETRELLRCIRCGACLNACPVYRNVGGGHAYGAVYSGPIGAVITPLLKGLENYPDLPKASSLCGACHTACPVDIDIPHFLVQHRRQMVQRHIGSPTDRLIYRLWAATLSNRFSYLTAALLARRILRANADLTDDAGDAYSDRGWIRHLGGPLSGWTSERDLPTPTSRGFRDWWREHSSQRARSTS